MRDDADDIIRRARQTLSQRPFAAGERQEDRQATSDPPVDRPVTVETFGQRCRRELEERDAEWERERERERRDVYNNKVDINVIDRRIATALQAERAATIPALRECIDELLEHERERAELAVAGQLKGLELQIVRLESAVSALQLALNFEKSKTVDLPNPLLRSVN